MPATIEIAIGAIILSLVVGIVLGTLAAYRRGLVTDQVIRVVTLVGLSVPTFWLALVSFYVFFLRAAHRAGLRTALAVDHAAAARDRPVHGRLLCWPAVRSASSTPSRTSSCR